MSVSPDREGAAGEPLDEGAEDVTLSGEDWPVAEQYRVQPAREAEPPADERGEVVVQDAGPPAEPAPFRRFPPDVSGGLAAALLAVLLLLLLIPAGIWLANRDDDGQAADDNATAPTTTSPTTTSPTTTAPPAAAGEVPNVVGQPLSDARAVLEEDGFRVRVSRVESEAPRDEVLRQRPQAGATAEPRSPVVLTVSGGREQVAVPEVEGMSRAEATATLREAGLAVRVAQVRSEEPRGTVVAQSPEAGEEVPDGTVVALQVSSGSSSSGGTTTAGTTTTTPSAPVTVRVPSVVGLRAAEARARLQDAGLRVTQRPLESSRPAGTVVSQSPSAGAEVREGRTITLQVSTGPARVTVPDVVGLNESAAVAELESAGFTVHVVDEPTTDPAEDGTVLRQSPASGTSAAEGATVTITVARVG